MNQCLKATVDENRNFRVVCFTISYNYTQLQLFTFLIAKFDVSQKKNLLKITESTNQRAEGK